MPLVVAHRTRPRAGEVANGDAALVVERDGRTLLVVVDGLGHGPEAAHAAELAVATFRAADLARGVGALVDDVHASLRGTRGAALTAVLIDATTVAACGVGNVSLRVVGGSLGFVASPGIVGANLRARRVASAARPAAARLYLHSDGVSHRFDPDALRALDCDAAAAQVFERFARDTDDATLLVADV